MPALQRASSRACVACGAPADLYCGQCALTPYCTPRCQRRDWAERHRAVCHNLARLNSASSEVSNIPMAAPLRRPHSPTTRDSPRRDGSVDRNQKPSGGANKQDSRPSNRGSQNYNNRNQNQNQNQNQNGYHNQSGANNQNRNNNNTGTRRFNKPAGDRRMPREEPDEEWGSKNANDTSGPTKPAVSSQEPTKPAVQSQQPTKPAVQSQEPTKPTVVSQEPTKPMPGKPAAQEANMVSTKPATKPPGSLDDVTPSRKIVPKSYLVEMLSVGDEVVLSLDAAASECRSERDGFVGLSLHDRYKKEYEALLVTYPDKCEADMVQFVPKPGDAFSYFNSSDEGWYRARCLTPSLAALLDSGRIVPLGGGDKIRRLAGDYEAMPEFCCLLTAKGVKIGDELQCKLVSKTADGFLVSMVSVENGENVGDGEIGRWLPTVEYPAPTTSTVAKQLPTVVPRPELKNGMRVYLVDCTAATRAILRPSDQESHRRYDNIVETVVLCGRRSQPLKEPPVRGQTVIGKFEGQHFRALCLRTNVAKNKYLLEYIEFGNEHITQLENIYQCPPDMDLSAVPTEASQAVLQMGWTGEWSTAAREYVQHLKENEVELVLNLPSGAKTAASGSAVTLTEVKTGKNVNTKLDELCTPDWKKMELSGGDVVQSPRLMFRDAQHPKLPANGGTLMVLDISAIETGFLSVCEFGDPRMEYVATTMSKRLADYCNSELGKKPYLPTSEELCVAKFLEDDTWYRAVIMEHFPGALSAKVCYIDYGNVADVSVSLLRKMLPEFINGEPILAANVDVKDFPKDPTPEMLQRALTYMKVNEEGQGVLEVTRCEKSEEDGCYTVEAKGLVTAMLGL